MSEAHFFINKKSWHYRYYSWIRKLYLGQEDDKDVTSLCPYFHTMLWGTVCAVLMTPMMLFTSVGLRVLRFVLKFNNPLVDWIDSKTPIGSLAKDGRQVFEDRPVVGGIMSGLGILLAVAFVGMVLFGAGVFVYFFPDILKGLWVGAEYAGWALFWFMGHVAWVLGLVGYGIAFVAGATWDAVFEFFTNGAMWLDLLVYTLWGITAIVVLAASGLLFWGVSKVPLMQQLGNWLIIKVNGYEKQRSIRTERIEKRKKVKKEADEWICPFCEGTNYVPVYVRKDCYHCGKRNPAIKYSMWERLGDWMDGVRGTEIHMPKRPTWVSLGFLESMSASFWSIKHRVCPTLTFVTDEELQKKVQEAIAADHEVNDAAAKRAAGIYNQDLVCPECDRVMNIPGSHVGETVQCSGCDHMFVVPKPKSNAVLAQTPKG